MNVDFAVLARQYEKYQTEYEEAALRVLRSGWYIMGKELDSFEEQFAQYTGAKYAAGVGNGLDALRLALEALGVGKGDEVIVQANTFIATALAVSQVGATPVFVDADAFFGIDASKIESAITENTKAVMTVHLYGQPCDMDPVLAIAKAHGLYVVEDCAQAHGATYKGKQIGTIGDVGCFSFYPMKPIGAFGDGGGVVTNNKDIMDKIKMIRNYGSRVKYHHELAGFNSRLDEMQAAIVSINTKHAAEGNAERQAIAEKYISGITNPKITLPAVRPDCTHVFHVFAMRCKDRDALQQFMADHGIRTQIHYPIPCHLAECYAELGYKAGDFPVAEQVANEELSLPIYVGLRDDEIDYIIDTINKF